MFINQFVLFLCVCINICVINGICQVDCFRGAEHRKINTKVIILANYNRRTQYIKLIIR